MIRPCGEEEDAARELLGSLDAEQRQAVVICEAPPPDFVLMNAPLVPETCLPGEVGSLPPVQATAVAMPVEQREALRFERKRPRGLPATQMNEGQRKLMSELIDIYVDVCRRLWQHSNAPGSSVGRRYISPGQETTGHARLTTTGYKEARSSWSTTTPRTMRTTCTRSGGTPRTTSARICSSDTFGIHTR